MIMLQRMSADGKQNLGGLFINRNAISAIYKSQIKNFCYILLNNGINFLMAQTIAEVLEIINEKES